MNTCVIVGGFFDTEPAPEIEHGIGRQGTIDRSCRQGAFGCDTVRIISAEIVSIYICTGIPGSRVRFSVCASAAGRLSPLEHLAAGAARNSPPRIDIHVPACDRDLVSGSDGQIDRGRPHVSAVCRDRHTESHDSPFRSTGTEGNLKRRSRVIQNLHLRHGPESMRPLDNRDIRAVDRAGKGGIHIRGTGSQTVLDCNRQTDLFTGIHISVVIPRTVIDCMGCEVDIEGDCACHKSCQGGFCEVHGERPGVQTQRNRIVRRVNVGAVVRFVLEEHDRRISVIVKGFMIRSGTVRKLVVFLERSRNIVIDCLEGDRFKPHGGGVGDDIEIRGIPGLFIADHIQIDHPDDIRIGTVGSGGIGFTAIQSSLLAGKKNKLDCIFKIVLIQNTRDLQNRPGAAAVVVRARSVRLRIGIIVSTDDPDTIRVDTPCFFGDDIVRACVEALITDICEAIG